jgi:hypothetical protein
MFTIIAIVALAIVAVFGIAASRPNQFRIERSASFKAAPESIFPLINDLHRWEGWSPFEQKDPAMKRSFSGAERGRGAIYGWEGNKDIGSGRMEITESAPSSHVVIKLDFFTPFKASNTAEFTLQPSGEGTRVTWAMYGPSPFMSKLMGLVFNMDKMVGTEFERGLVNLRTLTEA